MRLTQARFPLDWKVWFIQNPLHAGESPAPHSATFYQGSLLLRRSGGGTYARQYGGSVRAWGVEILDGKYRYIMAFVCKSCFGGHFMHMKGSMLVGIGAIEERGDVRLPSPFSFQFLQLRLLFWLYVKRIERGEDKTSCLPSRLCLPFALLPASLPERVVIVPLSLTRAIPLAKRSLLAIVSRSPPSF